jgi:hypothetical protein
MILAKLSKLCQIEPQFIGRLSQNFFTDYGRFVGLRPSGQRCITHENSNESTC